MTDELNMAARHRHGKAWDGVDGIPRMSAERKYPLWPVVLVLAVFWVGLILTVRACTKDDLRADSNLGAVPAASFSTEQGE